MRANRRAVIATVIGFTIAAGGVGGAASRAGAGGVPAGTSAVTEDPAADIAATADLGIQFFLLRARHSGKCAEYHIYSSERKVKQYPCDTFRQQQQWRLVATDSGYFRLVNPWGPNDCMEIVAIDNGADARTATCNSAYDQQFKFVTVTDNYQHVIARHSGKCLEVDGANQSDGAQVQQNPCSQTSHHQQWRRDLQVRYYQLQVRHTGKCLTRYYSNGDVVQLTCNASDRRMWWRGEVQELSYYSYINLYNGECLDITGASKLNGAYAQTYPCNGTHAQQFVQPFVSGQQEYRLIGARHSGKCIQVIGGATGDYSQVVQNVCDPPTNYRQWRFQ